MSTKQIIFVSLKMPNLWLEKRTITLSFFDSTIKKKDRTKSLQATDCICIILNQTILIIVKGEQREATHGHW